MTNDMRGRLIELLFTVTEEKDCPQPCEIADYLLTNGVIVPPCKVGDTVYFLLEDDFPVHKWFLSEKIVSEVCSKGFFTSAMVPAEDDLGNYTSYEEIGTEVFLTLDAAQAALKNKERESDAD